jgi:hypothetical protein
VKNHTLVDKIAALSEDQQAAVEKFIDYLREKPLSITNDNFHAALDSFIREHSDLLRRLAE